MSELYGEEVVVVRDSRNLQRTPHIFLKQGKQRSYKVVWESMNNMDLELQLLNKHGKGTGWFYCVKREDVLPIKLAGKTLEDYL